MGGANPYAKVTIRINGSDGSACSYPTCDQPTQFILKINKMGDITPEQENGSFDPMAATYLYYTKITKHSKMPRDARWFN